MIKKLILPAFLLMGAALYFSACTKDCKFKQTDYTGQFAVTEDCSSSAPTAYTVTVTADGETGLKISNFWGVFSNSLSATFDCETINIPRQQPDNDNFFVEGSGFIEKDGDKVTVTVSYTVSDETDPNNIKKDECTSTVFTKL